MKESHPKSLQSPPAARVTFVLISFIGIKNSFLKGDLWN